MSSKLKKQIVIELDQLRRLLNRHPELIEKCKESPPTNIEIDTLSALLHSFYTGIENILRRIAVHYNESLSHRENWHRNLLTRMTQSTTDRGAVISGELGIRLGTYLAFRHVFRHAYTFELSWPKIKPLVLKIKDTFHSFEEALNRFIESLDQKV